MTEKTPALSIVIVSYNVRDFLADCLASIYRNPPERPFEVWVVENSSNDGSLEMVRERFPQVNLLACQINLGFAAANNLAIPHCRGEYILFLNPDTLVYPNALDALVFFLDKNQQAGAAGSRLLNPDLSLQPSCYPFPTLGKELWRLLHLDAIYPLALYRQENWSTIEPRQVDVLQGTSLAVRRKMLEDLGYFDDTFFMYSEEVDLCYRIDIAGWQRYWVPASRVVHFGGQSTSQTAEKMFLQLYRAKTLYFRKNHGENAAQVYKAILGLAAILRLILAPLSILAGREKTRQTRLISTYYVRLLNELSGY